MRLTRRAHNTNTNHEPRELANKEFSSTFEHIQTNVKYSFDGKNFALRMLGVDGIKNSTDEYEYEITLTLKEVRTLLSHSLDRQFYPYFPGGSVVSRAEGKLWHTLFNQWAERVREIARIRELAEKKATMNKTLN